MATPAVKRKSLTALVLSLVVVFAAMMVDAGMSLAGPWPLKIVIDNVIRDHKLPEWLGG